MGHRPNEPDADSLPKTTRKPAKFRLARFAYISQFTGELLAFVGIGLYVDYFWDWTPWGTVGCGFLGLGLAMFHLIHNVLSRDEP